MTPGTRRAWWAALALAIHAAGAQADMTPSGLTSVLANDLVLVQGLTPPPSPIALGAPGAGELSVSLTPIGFPIADPFGSLSFDVATATSTLSSITNAGTEITLDLTAPTTVFANVFATTVNGSGLFDITANFVSTSTSTVSLPSSAASLAGGCLAILLLGLCADSFAQSRRPGSAQAAVTSPMA